MGCWVSGIEGGLRQVEGFRVFRVCVSSLECRVNRLGALMQALRDSGVTAEVTVVVFIVSLEVLVTTPIRQSKLEI